MQENSNLNRKGKGSNQCQESAAKSEAMLVRTTNQSGKLKSEIVNQNTDKREDAIDVLTYMGFKL
jgi:hypothetical protein